MNFINQLLERIKEKKNFSFKGNIWGVDLADTQLISKHNKGIIYFIYLFFIFS